MQVTAKVQVTAPYNADLRQDLLVSFKTFLHFLNRMVADAFIGNRLTAVK